MAYEQYTLIKKVTLEMHDGRIIELTTESLSSAVFDIENIFHPKSEFGWPPEPPITRMVHLILHFVAPLKTFHIKDLPGLGSGYDKIKSSSIFLLPDE